MGACSVILSGGRDVCNNRGTCNFRRPYGTKAAQLAAQILAQKVVENGRAHLYSNELQSTLGVCHPRGPIVDCGARLAHEDCRMPSTNAPPRLAKPHESQAHRRELRAKVGTNDAYEVGPPECEQNESPGFTEPSGATGRGVGRKKIRFREKSPRISGSAGRGEATCESLSVAKPFHLLAWTLSHALRLLQRDVRRPALRAGLRDDAGFGLHGRRVCPVHVGGGRAVRCS